MSIIHHNTTTFHLGPHMGKFNIGNPCLGQQVANSFKKIIIYCVELLMK